MAQNPSLPLVPFFLTLCYKYLPLNLKNGVLKIYKKGTYDKKQRLSVLLAPPNPMALHLDQSFHRMFLMQRVYE